MRCDEAVLAQLGDQVKRGYSLSLVSFAMERRFPAALAFGGHDAARRVKHVLAWKKETPRMAFLAAAVVLVVWMVCTSGGKTSSWVRVEGSGTAEFTCDLQEPIQSWAIYEDVYENGQLLFSEPCVFDGFQENGGAMSRQFSDTLTADAASDGEGFGGKLRCRLSIQDGTKATWTIQLPKDHYTGAGTFAGADRLQDSERHSLNGNDEALLYTFLLSTEPGGAVTGYDAKAGAVGANDTVVRFRLVTSTGGTGSFDSQKDLARTLFDLRVERSADSQGIRALLEYLGWEKAAALSLDALAGQDVLPAFLELLTSGACGNVPGSVAAAAMADSRSLLLNFREAPADPDGFDACAAKAAFLLMYVKPQVEEVAWTYPDTEGARAERKVSREELWVITSLFSDLEAVQTCPVTTQAELERLLSLAGLDSRVYLMWVRKGPYLTVTAASGERVTAAWYEDGRFDFDYDGLPTLTLQEAEKTLTLAVGGADALTVGEDYYTA